MAGSRTRRRWPWIVAVFALLAAGYGALHYLLQPERISAFLLAQASQATGLELTLGKPASVGVFPDVHIELHQLTATATGAQRPLLQVERVDAVLPWSALGGESIQLQRLRLLAPRLDTVALTHWLASREQEGPPAAFELPQLQAELVVERGSINAPDWSVAELDLTLSSLLPGQAASLALTGNWLREQTTHRFDLLIDATPLQDAGVLTFDPLVLTLHDEDGSGHLLRTEGELSLAPPRLQFGLRGSLPQWPAGWPPLPLPMAKQDAQPQVTFDARFNGSTTLLGALELTLERAGASMLAQLELGEVLAWLNADGASPLPPLQGTLRAETIEIEGIQLQGVQLRIDAIDANADSEAPAADATR